MPELRTDWLTGRAVLVAENRALRPNDFESSAPTGEAALAAGQPALNAQNCPFCAGNETRTPSAVYEAAGGDGRWQVRVVPNMYPAVSLDAEVLPSDASAQPALGAHEVIIESPRHVDRLSALSSEELRAVLAAYAQRLRHWQADNRFRYGLVFKNQGMRAGASLAHLHSQLITLADVPAAVHRELLRAEQDFETHGSCPYCRLIAWERNDGRRIVADGDGFIAFCPFASLQPAEVWLLPTAHQPWFEQTADDYALGALAGVLHRIVGKLESLVPGAAYNMLLRTSPWQSAASGAWHWRIELLPRITAFAGLELATGTHINPLPPEQAALRLRGA